ncbi:unnamed protein product [Brugia timori]|uniref:Uncharacterized protein n=1 Tax=Brugia timori TaxID=42155 RepID=A0A0R3R1V1_9BILA|nr:unnamed protein product [Brugia timori]
MARNTKSANNGGSNDYFSRKKKKYESNLHLLALFTQRAIQISHYCEILKYLCYIASIEALEHNGNKYFCFFLQIICYYGSPAVVRFRMCG